jgi:hypothetical protein
MNTAARKQGETVLTPLHYQLIHALAEHAVKTGMFDQESEAAAPAASVRKPGKRRRAEPSK